MATRREIQATLRAQVNRRDAKIQAFRNRLDRFLAINLDSILGEIESGDVQVLEAANILGGLRQAIDEAGLDEAISPLLDIYRDELENIEELFQLTANKPVLFSQADEQVIEQLVNFEIDRTRGQIFQYAEELKSVIMRSVLTGTAPKVSDLHEEIGDSYLNSLETELVTSVSGFVQSVNNQKAEEAGLNLFLYVGPDDDATRPFCDSVLHDREPPIYTKEEIEEMDNDQGLDVFVYGGGYNCRHQWSALDLETAKSLGYGEN